MRIYFLSGIRLHHSHIKVGKRNVILILVPMEYRELKPVEIVHLPASGLTASMVNEAGSLQIDLQVTHEANK